jgi:hypothetical protein
MTNGIVVEGKKGLGKLSRNSMGGGGPRSWAAMGQLAIARIARLHPGQRKLTMGHLIICL